MWIDNGWEDCGKKNAVYRIKVINIHVVVLCPLQVIQPTPCMSPSGGSQESFSDVPRHTEQLLPAASERFRKPPQPPRKTVSSSSTAAPIACIRTSCSSCSDDAVSTATTVNSSVFVDECCCTTASSPPPPLTHDEDDCDDGASLPSQMISAEPTKGRGHFNCIDFFFF